MDSFFNRLEMNPVVKTCPKCGIKFECNNHDIFNCQCIHAHLKSEVSQKISRLYEDCLCLNCLNQFANEDISQIHING